jgi:hypothetical protein
VSHQREHQFALQVILDRILKQMIKNEVEARKKKQPHNSGEPARPLTRYESNAIRYMAGLWQ